MPARLIYSGFYLMFACAAGAQFTVGTAPLRIEQGKALAAGKEMREWHFDKLPKELADFPSTVRGAFLRVVCEDHEFSTACVELVRDDFSRGYSAECDAR